MTRPCDTCLHRLPVPGTQHVRCGHGLAHDVAASCKATFAQALAGAHENRRPVLAVHFQTEAEGEPTEHERIGFHVPIMAMGLCFWPQNFHPAVIEGCSLQEPKEMVRAS